MGPTVCCRYARSEVVMTLKIQIAVCWLAHRVVMWWDTNVSEDLPVASSLHYTFIHFALTYFPKSFFALLLN